jgi:sec-independent protein translocase protein TatA
LYLFVFEFLGTSELMVILVVALMVFGPRKLPQLSRSLGKHLTEFRKASEDFKRTWEREVALDDMAQKPADSPPVLLPPNVTPAEFSIGRGQSQALPAAAANDGMVDPAAVVSQPLEPPVAVPAPLSTPVSSKRDWL